MKTERLIGILSLLLQTERITAAELAEKFEVSVRTVLRDIESINLAGIPVAAVKGKGGGIYIMDGYKIDSKLLSTEDMRLIFAGLKGLDSVSKTNKYKQLMAKLNTGDEEKDSIIIDLAGSGFDKSTISEKTDLIRAAISNKERISFTYFSPSDESERDIEPYHLVYQWAGWYVWGYCRLREDYRMFKLTRLTDLRLTGERCEERDVPEYSRKTLPYCGGGTEVSVYFDKSVKWRIIDEFGTELPDFDSSGNCTVKFTWTDVPSFFEYILSFGNKAEIIYPKKYREELIKMIESINKIYKTEK